jgi:hypothetical protein
VVPFHLETKLRGVYERGPISGGYAARDGNLITEQNPASSALIAQHIIAAVQGKWSAIPAAQLRVFCA